MRKLLIIGYVWPEPESSAAGSRMMQLISFFLKENYKICFATTAAPTPYMVVLKELGVETKTIQLNNASFDVFLSEFIPEVVLFDRFMMEEQFGWRVAKVCSNAIKVLDTEDLHFLRKARQNATRDNTEVTISHLQSDTAKREIASIYRCDLSLIISESEMELLIKEFQVPKMIIHYLPLLEENFSQEESFPTFEEREHFISIGNFKHEPNWDAVLQLKHTIWPLIRYCLPNAELHIYGAYPTQKVFLLNSLAEGFFVLGRADSARETIKKARILLAPLRFGAGIKGKFMDAMSVGTPNVTTTIGAEAMSGGLPWSGKIENDLKAFALAAVDLYTDQVQWNQAQTNGFNILQERYSSNRFHSNLRGRLEALREDLVSHRVQNFTGAMLQHHRVNSTHYLSKYIEVKNKFLDLLNAKSAQ